MLAIRMQRTGRKGHAMFRVVVQDARRTPTSGKIVASLGSYDPHAKTVVLDKEKAVYYLEHGAQPSERAAHLLNTEGVKLPAWVSLGGGKQGKLRYPDKLRRNRPAEEPAPEAEGDNTAGDESSTSEAPAVEASAAESTEAGDAEKSSTENPATENPTDNTSA